MGYFILRLSTGEQAAVWSGSIFRKTFSLNPFRKREAHERKRGYIVRVGDAREYRLLRTLGGQWLSGGEKGFPASEEDACTAELKAAILQHESE
jgi:hypothetical protein